MATEVRPPRRRTPADLPNINFLRQAFRKLLTTVSFWHIWVLPVVYLKGLSRPHPPIKYRQHTISRSKVFFTKYAFRYLPVQPPVNSKCLTKAHPPAEYELPIAVQQLMIRSTLLRISVPSGVRLVEAGVLHSPISSPSFPFPR